jgi:hypothetical protein
VVGVVVVETVVETVVMETNSLNEP